MPKQINSPLQARRKNQPSRYDVSDSLASPAENGGALRPFGSPTLLGHRLEGSTFAKGLTLENFEFASALM